MRAIQMSEYGGPEVLRARRAAGPRAGPGRGPRPRHPRGPELRRHAPAHEHLPRQGRAAARARRGGRGRARGHRRAGRRAAGLRRLRRVRGRAGRADVPDPRRRLRRDGAGARAPGADGLASVPHVRARGARRERRRARRGGRRRLARRAARQAARRRARHRDGLDGRQARPGARARRRRGGRRRGRGPDRAARRGEPRRARRRRLRDGGRRRLRRLAGGARAVRAARDVRDRVGREQHGPQRLAHAPVTRRSSGSGSRTASAARR